MNQQKHMTSQARIWTGFYRCHLIFLHSVSRRWNIKYHPLNASQYQATAAARIGIANSQNHCIRICMNLYPVELCAFACLGALNHDRPIVACPDLALWQYCWLCWAKVSGRSENMQNWRRISLKTSRRLKLVAWIQVEFRFGKILAPLCTGMSVYWLYCIVYTPKKRSHGTPPMGFQGEFLIWHSHALSVFRV